MLKEGDKAPAFELPSDRGDVVRLSDFKGSHVVVYFYPKDDTPGCTREAQAFSAALLDLAKAGAKIVGISKDSVATHCRFRDKYALAFPLLSDPSLSVHKSYGAFGEKSMYGKKVTGVLRSTFVVGPDGKLVKVFPNVKVDGHADAVLAVLRGTPAAARTRAKVKTAAAPAPKKTRAPKKSAAKKAVPATSKRAAAKKKSVPTRTTKKRTR